MLVWAISLGFVGVGLLVFSMKEEYQKALSSLPFLYLFPQLGMDFMVLLNRICLLAIYNDFGYHVRVIAISIVLANTFSILEPLFCRYLKEVCFKSL